jgi:hypothetical protein
MKNMRIPRKKKKLFKKLWAKETGLKYTIIKSSIKYDEEFKVWGCIANTKQLL